MSTPYSGSTEATRQTSIEAANAIEPVKQSLKDIIYQAFLAVGVTGLTDDEIFTRTQIDLNTIRPRRVELFNAGKIEVTGRKRQTRSGRNAAVWIATTFSAEQA